LKPEALFVIVTTGLVALTFALGMFQLTKGGAHLSTTRATVALGGSIVAAVDGVGANQTGATIWLPPKITGYAYQLVPTSEGIRISVDGPENVSINFKTNYPVKLAVENYWGFVHLGYRGGEIWITEA